MLLQGDVRSCSYSQDRFSSSQFLIRRCCQCWLLRSNRSGFCWQTVVELFRFFNLTCLSSFVQKYIFKILNTIINNWFSCNYFFKSLYLMRSHDRLHVYNSFKARTLFKLTCVWLTELHSSCFSICYFYLGITLNLVEMLFH